MHSKQAFFDRLKTYYDFRNADASSFHPTSLRNLALELMQLCGAMCSVSGRVSDETHLHMIAKIIGEEPACLKMWSEGGFLLSEGARLLAQAVNRKFNFSAGD